MAQEFDACTSAATKDMDKIGNAYTDMLKCLEMFQIESQQVLKARSSGAEKVCHTYLYTYMHAYIHKTFAIQILCILYTHTYIHTNIHTNIAYVHE